MLLRCTDFSIQFNCLKLMEKFRSEFKRPYGIVLSGSGENSAIALVNLVKERKPPKFVAVGDVVAGWMLNLNFIPDLSIVDFKVGRKIRPFNYDSCLFSKVLRVSNPAGCITCEAWLAIQYALALDGKYLMIVDGEEDLLALPAVLCSPFNSIVAFGLPGEGIMAVPVDYKARMEAFRLLRFFEPA
ncbi:MAG: hypothetical protein DRJ18_00505 [Candidatus Methanomethylicota archaeon]|nr:MAG: hypothetical protein DRJ18_00505 [Candidatus Verstraetearchaeota archaeon]